MPYTWMPGQPRKKLKTHGNLMTPVNNILPDITPLRSRCKVFRFACRTWISHKFKHYARLAGLAENRFHDLQHTLGAQLTMSGGDLRSIQSLIRHKSITSTMICAKVSPGTLKADI